MKHKLFAVSALTLALAACDDNDITAGTNNVEGTIEIGGFTASGVPFVGRELVTDINDPNGVESDTVVYQWMSGGVAISGATSSEYTVLEADVGNTLTVSATYIDQDGFDESFVSEPTEIVTVTPINTVGIITVSGTPTVGEELEAAIDDANIISNTVTYQWFRDGAEIEGATNDEYELVDEDFDTIITVQATYEDNDGFSEDIISVGTTAIAAVPVDAPEIVTTQVAQVSDTIDGDTGELRLNPDEATFTSLIQGRLEFSFISEELERTSPTAGTSDAGVSIMGSSTSTSSAFVDLRLRNGSLEIRNTDLSIPYAFDEVVDVIVTWDGTANTASNETAPLVTVSINGQLITPDGFTSISNSLSSLVGGVDRFQFRVGDSDDVATGSLFIDDLVIYSDAAGNTPVFTENFDGLTIGESLVNANRFSSGGSEAVVAEIDLPTEDTDSVSVPSTISGLAASISDPTSTSADGELRYTTPSGILEGTVSLVINREDLQRTNTTGNANSGVTLFANSTSGANAIVDLTFNNDGTIDIDNLDGLDDTSGEEAGTYLLDTDTLIEFSWSTDGVTAPEVSVTVNGTVIADEVESIGTLANVVLGLQNLQVSVGDSSNTTDGVVLVDNIIINEITTVDGVDTVTEVLNEDFEGLTVNEAIDGTDDVFSSNSADTTVVNTAL